MTQKISEYAIKETELLPDDTLLDVSVKVSELPDVWDTRSAEPSTINGLIATGLAEDFGIGTERVISLTWNCSAKVVAATHLILKQVAGGKGGTGIKIRIGSTSGGDNIMPLTTLQGYGVSGYYIIHLNGTVIEMFSDSDTIFFDLVEAATAANTTDIRLYGKDFDV